MGATNNVEDKIKEGLKPQPSSSMTDSPKPVVVDEHVAADQTRKTIKAEVASGVRKAVDDEIEQGVNDVRNGVIRDDKGKEKEGSFFEWIWAAIKSVIFAIAEFMGFEKTLASWMGTPIPEKDEVKAISNQVGESVSRVVTDDNFKFNNSWEYQSGIQEAVRADLEKNRKKFPSFSKEDRERIAEETAAKYVKEPLVASMFNKDGYLEGPNLMTDSTTRIAAVQFKNEFNKTLLADDGQRSRLASMVGKKDFTAEDVDSVSYAIAPVLRNVSNAENHKYFKDAELKDDKGHAAVTELSQDFQTKLKNNLGTLKRGGAEWNADNIEIMADHMAIGYLKKEVGMKVPESFEKALEEKTARYVVTTAESRITKEVSDGIREEVVVGAMKSYDDRVWYSTTNNSFAYGQSAANIEELQKFYKKDDKNYTLRKDLTGEEKGDLMKLQDKVYKFAADKGMAPSVGQRQQISEITAKGVLDELDKDSNFKLTPDKMTNEEAQALSTRLRSAVRDTLEKPDNVKKIDQAGTTTIGRINLNSKTDVFKSVSEGLGKEVEKNGEVFDSLNHVRESAGGRVKEALNRGIIEKPPVPGLDATGNYIPSPTIPTEPKIGPSVSPA